MALFQFKSNGKIKKLVDLVYPVGSIYISTSATNPGTLFGGTWEQFAQGRTLIGAGVGNDGSTSMSFTPESSGGSYKHKLSNDELPMHSHWIGKSDQSNLPEGYSDWGLVRDGGFGGSVALTTSASGLCVDSATGSTGSYVPFNILQPFIVVYYWKRTN